MNKKTISFLMIICLLIAVSSGCPVGAGSSGDNPPGGSSENNPPYAVNGPADVNFEYRFDEPYYVTLTTDAPGADLDPDGDPVSFHFSYAGSDLVVDINSVTGVLSVDTITNSDYQETVTVWTEDESGTKSADFTVTIHVSLPS